MTTACVLASSDVVRVSFSVVPTGKGAYISCISEWELYKVGVKKTWPVGLGDNMFLSISDVSYLCVYKGLMTCIQGTKAEMCAGPLLDAIVSVTLGPYRN